VLPESSGIATDDRRLRRVSNGLCLAPACTLSVEASAPEQSGDDRAQTPDGPGSSWDICNSLVKETGLSLSDASANLPILSETLEITGQSADFRASVTAFCRKVQTDGVAGVPAMQFYASHKNKEAYLFLSFKDEDAFDKHVAFIMSTDEVSPYLNTVRFGDSRSSAHQSRFRKKGSRSLPLNEPIAAHRVLPSILWARSFLARSPTQGKAGGPPTRETHLQFLNKPLRLSARRLRKPRPTRNRGGLLPEQALRCSRATDDETLSSETHGTSMRGCKGCPIR
jgi:hypothetical protein